jgi:hypothetical protein
VAHDPNVFWARIDALNGAETHETPPAFMHLAAFGGPGLGVAP